MCGEAGWPEGWQDVQYVVKTSAFFFSGHLTYLYLGQNCRRASRPRQDPFSSIQPPIRQVHRLLVWCCDRTTRHQPGGWATRTISRALCHSPPHLSLRRHQVPRLRAIPLSPHPNTRSRNTFAPPPVRLLGRDDVRLLHLPSRGHPRAAGVRNEARLTVESKEDL